ncbi:MAG TPA: LCP family protein [Candidatus Saccharimonadales bacterium]
MNNFRKEPRRSSRQTIDGLISAPQRPQLVSRSFASQQSGGGASLRSNSRTIGDFKRADGYHLANSPVSPQPQRLSPKAQPSRATDSGSLLHMTLPGAKLDDSAKERKGRRFFRLRRTHGRRRPLTKWGRVRKYSLRGGLVALALLLLTAGFLATKGYFKLHKVFKGGGSAAALNTNVAPSLLKGEGDGRVNIMLLGIGGDGHEGADLTDTIIIASIDPVNKKAALVSIPRDLWVTTPYGSSKINAVYAYAKQRGQAQGKKAADAIDYGLDQIQNELKTVTGITIHYRALVDFKAFEDAVNTVGGVDLNVTQETSVTDYMYDEATHKPYTLKVTPGLQHFDGLRALMYARSRHTSARGDFDRSERQRLLIEAIVSKVASAGTYTNPVKLSSLMDNFGAHVDTDISIDDAIKMMRLGKQIGSSYDSIDLADPAAPIFKTGMVGSASVVLPVAGIGDYSKLQALLRSKLKDGYILKENANITVLNGTSWPGLAAQKADELKGYGYNVGTVDSAPTSNYTSTVIVDLTNGKNPYTKNYLEKRFGVKSTTTLPDKTIQPGNASFVIILGQDETTNSQN